MENNNEFDFAILDIATSILPILHYISTQGVAMVHNDRRNPENSIIYLTNDMFKRLFPDIKPNESGWYPVVSYGGYKVRAFSAAAENDE